MRSLRFLLLLIASAARAEDCIPPTFYTSLPRDQDWYYGVAAEPDTDDARKHALRNLGRQVSGEMEAWNDADIEAVAGPGHDRTLVAQDVAKLLPQSSLLAGWEQDDFERCNGKSYVLVRIQKSQVLQYIKENRKFKDDLVAALTQRVEKVEKDVAGLQAKTDKQAERIAANERETAELKKLVAALERKQSRLPQVRPDDQSAKDDLDRKVVAVKEAVAAGRPVAEVKKRLAEAEGAYEGLSKRVAAYDAVRQERAEKKLEAFKAEADPKIEAILARIWTGPVAEQDARDVGGYYERTNQREAAHAFYHKVQEQIASKGLADSGRRRSIAGGSFPEFVAFRLVFTAFPPDGEEAVKDSEAFLRDFPDSRQYRIVRSRMQRSVRMGAGRSRN